MIHPRAPLSPRQRDVLWLIVRIFEVAGEAPSERCIARKLGMTHRAVQDHLAMLYRKGWLHSPSPAGIRCLHVPDAQPSPSD